MVVVLAQQPVGGEPQVVEGGADAGEIVPGLRRQRQRAVLPDEQADPEFLLQPPDLMADRGLRDVQFGRGTVKLKCRAAASNARNPFSEGNLAVIPGSPNT